MFGIKRRLRPASEEWMDDVSDILSGNKLNATFEELYSGDCTWSYITNNIRVRLDDMTWNGLISYKTACRIVNIITLLDKNVRVVSENSDIISLGYEDENFRSEGTETEQFKLLDFMQWFIYELTHDACLENLMFEKTYSGIMDYLNKMCYVGNIEECLFCYREFVPPDDLLDGFLFYIKNKSLYLKYAWQSGEGAIICDDVKDGCIYWVKGADYLAVNSLNENRTEEVVIFETDTGEEKGALDGVVYGISGNYALMKTGERFCFLNMETMQKKELPEKKLPYGYLIVTEHGVVCRSFTGESCNEICCVTKEKTRYNKYFDIQVGWQILIDRCFNLTGLDLSKSIRNRLIVFDVYRPPFPMTLQKVKEHFDKITRYIGDGSCITLRKDFVCLTEVISNLETTVSLQDDVWEALKKSGLTIGPSEAQLEEHILWKPPYVELFDKVNCLSESDKKGGVR